MGDRVSIAFRFGDHVSPVLCHHWGGAEFKDAVIAYLKELDVEAKARGSCMPLHRLEPGTVMVDFIRWLTSRGGRSTERVESSIYIEVDRSRVDDSDNGHFEFNLDDGTYIHKHDRYDRKTDKFIPTEKSGMKWR